MNFRCWLSALVCLASVAVYGADIQCAGRDDLPRVLQNACYGDKVDRVACPYHDDDFGIFENNRAPFHYLLVPRQKTCGIESPMFWQSGSMPWFGEAWRLRSVFANARKVSGGVPLARVGIAINSVPGRSQGQLHVHISCVAQDVARQLAAAGGQISADWQPLMLDTVSGPQRYLARRLPGNQITPDLFAQLAASHPDLAASEGNATAFAATVDFRLESGAETVVLVGQYGVQNQGHAEDLLSGCANAVSP